MSTSGTSDEVRSAGPLDHVAAHLVRRVHQRHARLWAEEVGSDLTPPQFGVLVVVADEPGLDLTAVGARAALDRTTVGRVVDRLVDAGLLDRAARPDDRRHTVVSPTAAGRALLAHTTSAATRANDRLLAPLAPRERATVQRLLAAMADEP